MMVHSLNSLWSSDLKLQRHCSVSSITCRHQRICVQSFHPLLITHTLPLLFLLLTHTQSFNVGTHSVIWVEHSWCLPAARRPRIQPRALRQAHAESGGSIPLLPSFFHSFSFSQFTPFQGCFSHLFEGKILNSIRCTDIPFESLRVEPFFDLSVPVKDCRNLEESFEKMTQTETLDGDNKYHVDGQGFHPAKKVCYIHTLTLPISTPLSSSFVCFFCFILTLLLLLLPSPVN